jgi:hypothetical protein
VATGFVAWSRRRRFLGTARSRCQLRKSVPSFSRFTSETAEIGSQVFYLGDEPCDLAGPVLREFLDTLGPDLGSGDLGVGLGLRRDPLGLVTTGQLLRQLVSSRGRFRASRGQCRFGRLSRATSSARSSPVMPSARSRPALASSTATGRPPVRLRFRRRPAGAPGRAARHGRLATPPPLRGDARLPEPRRCGRCRGPDASR